MPTTDISNNQSDFPSDQAAILRDLARNGAADEANMYGYADMGSNIQSNGANPSQDFSFSDAYPVAGLSNNFQDMEDPAALLESLAGFDHVPSGNDARESVSNDHFASLLQAAATAGGAEIAHTGRAHEQENAGLTGQSDTYGFFKRTFAPELRSKRKRKARELDGDAVVAEEEDGGSYGLISNKRRKKAPQPEDEDQLAREREIWGPEDDEDDTSVPDDSFRQAPIATADARAVGVHSAAALFRRPSTASKKYTRPPMSKLFTSLELTPEQFLHLQAAAKNYMLDENYPERRDCVGNRGRGDTDMVKLKLFGCVKSFLEDEGWGERCFGENSSGSIERKLKWPQMKNKVISLVTPLLRRMVTNERQRQYALETREEKRRIGEKTGGKRQRDRASATPTEGTPQRKCGRRGISPSPYDDVDPKLDEYHYNVEETYPSEGGDGISKQQTGDVAGNQFSIGETDESGIKYHINVLQNGRRIKPVFTLTPTSCPGFSSLVQYIHTLLDDVGQKPSSVKVLSPEGLVEVNGEESWEGAVTSVKDNDWMDGDVKCVVEVVGIL